MKTSQVFLILISLLLNLKIVGQDASFKRINYFDNPIITDSNSTIIIPIKYNESIFSSNSMKFSYSTFANIIFYNFNTDSSFKLFSKNTFIQIFNYRTIEYYDFSKKEISNKPSKYLFYSVQNVDYNKNNKIDDKDPAILYVSDINGFNLRRISQENENIISFQVYEKQNFALIKIQIDSNNDKNFDTHDTEFYYIKINLINLQLGNKIEI